MPSVTASRTRAQPLDLALELGRRVAVHVGVGAHLARVPEVRRLVDALEPRHAVEGLGDEHDDVLRAALALRRRAARVGDARAPEHARDRASSGPRPGRGSARALCGSGGQSKSPALCGPTQATASVSATSRATARTSSSVTASSCAIAASGSIGSS